MPSRFFNRLHKTLAFRLTFWYSAIFILSSLTLLIVSYLFVFSTVRDNRSAIEAQLSKYQSLVESRGIGALESVIQAAARSQPAQHVFRSDRRCE